jgi:DNA-binding CsgD family transcriptional regulator
MMGIVRKLVAQAGDHAVGLPVTRAGEDPSENIIFDTEVDGVRCLLMRATPLEAEAINLSPREQEIARMIAKGYPNKTIASVLDISLWTVGTHLRRMFAKAGVSSRAALVAQLASTRYLQGKAKG